MRKVLVTGVAGFIGNEVVKELLRQGYEVIGIDSVNDAYDVAVKNHRLANLEGESLFEFRQGDIEDLGFLKSVFEGHAFDAVINLAARAGVRYSMINPSVYLQTNAQGTLNLLELMRESDVKKIVLASTSSLYAGHEMPFQEDMPVNRPLSSYAASKKAAELMCHSYHHLFDMDVSIVRYFTVYGPAGRPDMCIFRFIKWIDEGVPIEILGDGLQSRDFTFVEDVARATVAALKPVGYEIINVGGGNEPVSLKKVIEMLEKLLGKPSESVFKEVHIADIKETRADVRKAREILGWSREVDLEEGLRRTVDWYIENKSWVKNVKL